MPRLRLSDIQPNYGDSIEVLRYLEIRHPNILQEAMCATGLLKPTSRVQYVAAVTPQAISRQALDIAIRTGVVSSGTKK